MNEPAAQQDDPRVHLTVSGFSYTTTRSVLLTTHHTAEEKNYFHALLSGRWTNKQNDKNETSSLVISDRDGRLFLYILYYLQLGELPRSRHTDKDEYDSSLPRNDILMLKAEADFYGLEGLVLLCNKVLQVLKQIGSVGDIDVSPYSDITGDICKRDFVSNHYYSYIVQYTYKKSKTVTVVYRSNSFRSNSLTISLQDDESKCCNKILDNRSHLPVFRHIQEVITKLYGETKRDKELTVSEVLAEVPTSMIPDELRLWWALEVYALISFYDKHMNWEFVFSLSDDSVIEFQSWYLEGLC